MKERPILFSGPMTRALLDGTKTQTRRLVKLAGVTPDAHGFEQADADPISWLGCDIDGTTIVVRCKSEFCRPSCPHFDPMRDPADHGPACPGEDCPMCNGEACDLCGAGTRTRAPGEPRCEHDVIERHRAPDYGPTALDPVVLCPKCETTIGHAESTVIAEAVWHTACVAVELMKRAPIECRVELAARLRSDNGRGFGDLAHWLRVADDADTAAAKAFPPHETAKTQALVDVWRKALAPVFVGVVEKPSFTIYGDDGLGMVLDALARYLADKPADALRAIAALVNTLPRGLPAVDLGSSPDALAFVSSLPGAKPGRTHAADDTGDDIAYVYAAVDGVQFVARQRQPRTR